MRQALIPLLLLAVLGGAAASAAPSVAQKQTTTTAGDPHRVEPGFFDIHVCNWPDRPLFLYALFSTTEFAQIRAITVHAPDGAQLGALDLERYRLVDADGRPKRVFMYQFPIPAGAGDGWYGARVELRDGRSFEARDFVVLEAMQRASGLNPPDQAEGIPVPARLSWQPVPGATHYQVFLKDMWQDGKLVFSSPLLSAPEVTLPEGLLAPGGWYLWRVHARDVNENVVLGDFNHGSLTAEASFTTAE
ncbi:MAG TPA: hypothetical protein VIX81_04295 [Gammaproteobacteria bacterium]